MNNLLLQIIRGQKLIQPIPFKNLFILKRHSKIKTDQRQINPEIGKQSILKTERSGKIHSKFDNINSLSCILSRQKKSQSIGYKQYKQQSMKRRSLIKFQPKQQQSERYQSKQIQKDGTKYMFSLKKKFSVQPTSVKFKTEADNAIFRSSILNSERGLHIRQIEQKKFFNSELKSIISEIKDEQHNFCVQGLSNSKNLSQQNCNSIKFKHQNNGVRLKQKGPFFQKKPYCISNKRRDEKKMDKIRFNESNLKLKSKDSFIATTIKDKQQNLNLCGWSSRSFYPNGSALFFKNSRIKMNLWKGNIQ